MAFNQLDFAGIYEINIPQIDINLILTVWNNIAGGMCANLHASSGSMPVTELAAYDHSIIFTIRPGSDTLRFIISLSMAEEDRYCGTAIRGGEDFQFTGVREYRMLGC